MYFYIIEGGTHDSYDKDVYCSETYYSQKEFEDIVINAYKYVCEEVKAKKPNFYRCFRNFEVESICWESEFGDNDFIDWIEKNTDLKIINNPNASMYIGTCTTPSEDTRKLERAIAYSKVPHCRYNCCYKSSDNPFDKYRCYYPDIRSKARLEIKRKYPD